MIHGMTPVSHWGHSFYVFGIVAYDEPVTERAVIDAWSILFIDASSIPEIPCERMMRSEGR